MCKTIIFSAIFFRSKIITFTLLCTVIFSCNKHTIYHVDLYEPSKRSISFDADNFDNYVADHNVRGVIIKGDNFSNGDSFGVLGYYLSDGTFNGSIYDGDTPDFMYNQKVTKEGGNLNYSPIMYWPSNPDQKIKFFAYHPYSTKLEPNGIILPTNTTSGYPTIEFKPKKLARQQVDFMTAQSVLLNKDSVSIRLRFEHQLSQVTFSANHNGSITDTVVITEIQLEGTRICESGYFIFDDDSQKGEFKWRGESIYMSDAPVYTIKASDSELIPDIENSDQAYLPVVAPVIEENNHKLISMTNGILLLHPQKFGENDIKVTITFNVRSGGKDEVIVTNKITKTAGHDYLKGQRTNYRFTIDVKNNIGVDLIDITVEDWINRGSLTGDGGVVVE